MKPIIPSINYHLTKACNMQCKFCFATFNDLGVVKHDAEKSKKIIAEVAKNGFEKITFAGGEPTLVKELPALVQYAKELGLITTIVTNGAKLAQEELLNQLAPYLDWVALSIDSVNDATNLKSGRALNGKATVSESYFVELIPKLKKQNIRVKINTVVSKYNWEENLHSFIINAKPDRWKILQALKVNGQNTEHQTEFDISKHQFNSFLQNNSKAITQFKNAIEPIQLIKGSYLMISPEGKLYDNTTESYTYSDDILQIGLNKALSQINIDKSKFIDRNGFYDWSNSSKAMTRKQHIA